VGGNDLGKRKRRGRAMHYRKRVKGQVLRLPGHGFAPGGRQRGRARKGKTSPVVDIISHLRNNARFPEKGGYKGIEWGRLSLSELGWREELGSLHKCD